MLTCAHCGNSEPEGAGFCGNCGTPFPADADVRARTAPVGAETLICASCGNEEPVGARFCGSCGSPLPAGDQESAGTAPLEEPPAKPEPAVHQQGPLETPTPDPQRPPRSRRWVVVGAVGLLLAAAAVAAGAYVLLGDGGSRDTVSTDRQPPPSVPTGSAAPTVSQTLDAGITPSLQSVAVTQSMLAARVRSLVAGVESFAALRESASVLAASVARAQISLDAVTATDATEVKELLLVRRALDAHLAYASAIAHLPARPRLMTGGDAQAVIAEARQAEFAYDALAAASPALPRVVVSSADNARLLAVVPKPVAATTTRSVDLVPLFAGIRPDDPPGEGRCFGPYTARASLRVSGIVHHTGFVQCGDDANGDPGRASGVYRFSGLTLPAGSKVVRVTAEAAIDESSSPSQRGSRVTWTVLYNGTPICSETVVWSGTLPLPRHLDCTVPAPAAAGVADVNRLRILQVVSPASSGSLWVGLLDPTLVIQQ